MLRPVCNSQVLEAYVAHHSHRNPAVAPKYLSSLLQLIHTALEGRPHPHLEATKVGLHWPRFSSTPTLLTHPTHPTPPPHHHPTPALPELECVPFSQMLLARWKEDDPHWAEVEVS